MSQDPVWAVKEWSRDDIVVARVTPEQKKAAEERGVIMRHFRDCMPLVSEVREETRYRDD